MHTRKLILLTPHKLINVMTRLAATFTLMATLSVVAGPDSSGPSGSSRAQGPASVSLTNDFEPKQIAGGPQELGTNAAERPPLVPESVIIEHFKSQLRGVTNIVFWDGTPSANKNMLPGNRVDNPVVVQRLLSAIKLEPAPLCKFRPGYYVYFQGPSRVVAAVFNDHCFDVGTPCSMPKAFYEQFYGLARKNNWPTNSTNSYSQWATASNSNGLSDPYPERTGNLPATGQENFFYYSPPTINKKWIRSFTVQ